MGCTAEWDQVHGDGECSKGLFGSLDKFTMIDPTGANGDHVVGSIVGLDIRGEVVTLD